MFLGHFPIEDALKKFLLKFRKFSLLFQFLVETNGEPRGICRKSFKTKNRILQGTWGVNFPINRKNDPVERKMEFAIKFSILVIPSLAMK